MDIWALLGDIVVLLTGALILGGLVARVGQSPLVGYLLAGMLLGGAGSLGWIQNEAEIRVIAELGVSLLLFSIGLEFSPARLRALGRSTLMGGTSQVVITMGVCWVGAMLCGLGGREALAVGAMVALSSTAVVMRVLMEKGELESPHGRNSLAVLLVQDIAVVPLALLIAFLAGGESVVGMLASVGKMVGLSALLILALYVLLNYVATRALGTLTLERNRELTIVLGVVTGLGSAGAAHAIGLSPALGALVAGMFLGSSQFVTQLRADVSSLRVVLLTLFFGSAGMMADPVWIVENILLVVGVAALLMLTKGALVWTIFRFLGRPSCVAAATALCLCQVGEFAFVLGAEAYRGGVIGDETRNLMVSVTIVALFASPFLLPRASRLGTWLSRWLPGPAGSAGMSDQESARSRPHDVIIIGFGPAGQLAAVPFVDGDMRVLVIDLNEDGVRLAREQGFDADIGDATQFDVLEHAHVESARAVIITVPHHAAAVRIVSNVRQLSPLSHIVVRSRYHRDTHALELAGAHVVVGDEEEVGHQLGKRVRTWAEIQPEPTDEGTPELEKHA